jgi:hypothetical protein
MRPIIIGLAWWASLLPAQTVINGGRTIQGAWDASGATMTKPARTGISLPAACSVGEIFFSTTAAAGENLYVCAAANSWAQLAGGAGLQALRPANNLSDLGSAAAARTNLGLGTAATQPSSAFEPAIAPGTGAQYWSGTKGWQNLPAAIQSAMAGLYQTPITTGTADQALNGTLGLTALPNCAASGGVLWYSTATHQYSCHTLLAADIPALNYQAPIGGAPGAWPISFTPAAHASTHASAGGDPVTPAAIGALPLVGGTLTGNLTTPATILGPKTIGAGASQLSAAASCPGCVTVVTDGASASDCTTGGGTSAALCRSSGLAWMPLGGSAGGAMAYPGAGLPVSTGAAWAASLSPGAAGHVVRSNGTAYTDAAIQAADMPAGFCIPTRYTTAYTDAGYAAAATSASTTLLTLGARQRLCSVDFDPQSSFAGTGITSVTCSLGSATGGNGAVYMPASPVGPTMAAGAKYGFAGLMDPAYLTTPDSSRAVVLTCNANTNFGNGAATVLTAGQVYVTVGVVTLP